MKAVKQSVPTFWHPSFRMERELPDTKVIRTSFAVNAVAVVAVLAAGAFLYTREARLSEMNAQIDAENAKIEAAKPRVSKALELQKQFSVGEKKIRDIDVFVVSKLPASELLVTISETLPRLIVLDTIDASAETIRLRGSVIGSSERSAPLANAYTTQLGENPVFKGQIASIRLNNQSRDQVNDRFTFEIEMKLRSDVKPPQAPAKQVKKPSDDEQP